MCGCAFLPFFISASKRIKPSPNRLSCLRLCDSCPSPTSPIPLQSLHRSFIPDGVNERSKYTLLPVFIYININANVCGLCAVDPLLADRNALFWSSSFARSLVRSITPLPPILRSSFYFIRLSWNQTLSLHKAPTRFDFCSVEYPVYVIPHRWRSLNELRQSRVDSSSEIAKKKVINRSMKNYIYIVTQFERGRENTLGSQLDPIGTRFLISKFRATDSSKAKAFSLVLFVFLVVCSCACIVLIE